MKNDTICAISTPHGVGGIAVIRVSGPEAVSAVMHLWKGKELTSVASHTAHLGNVTTEKDEILDQAVATVFLGPNSYTGEDVVELSVHGSVYVQQRLVDALCHVGARLAEPGEFTRRAFSAGKIDLLQAESVADILASRTEAAHKLAMSQLRGGISKKINSLREKLINLASLMELELDFSEEDVEFANRHTLIETAQQVCDEVQRLHDSYATGSAIKNGLPIAIVGPTNSGKSSILNALTGDDRAIVSDIHGTTRDVIEDTILIDGTLFRLMDTAGIRDTADPIEQLGIARSRKALTDAAIILNVQSPDTIPVDLAIPATTPVITILNKSDLATTPATPEQPDFISLSAKTGQGIPALKAALKSLSSRLLAHETDTLITNLRQQQTLAAALATAREVLDALCADLPTVLVAQPLRETIRHLSLLTGAITDTTLLTTIFTRFCIGK